MPRLLSGSYRKDRRKGNRQIVPTVMLGSGTTQVYIQNGQVYKADGKHMPNPPEWVADTVMEMDKSAQERLGFQMKFGKLKPKDAVPKGEESTDLTTEDDKSDASKDKAKDD